MHDFKLFKNTTKNIKKSSKKNPLTKEDKLNNKRISKDRIIIEQINGTIKVFRIIAEKYRNHRKRQSLRMSLICGIYNYKLNIK